MSKGIKLAVAATCFALAGIVILWSNGVFSGPSHASPESIEYNSDGQVIGSRDENGRIVVRGDFTPEGAF